MTQDPTRWYASAVAYARTIRLASGRHIRIIDPAHLLATKIEAFHQRGGGDHLHHDSEDLVTLIDGRRRLLKMPGHLGSNE